MLNTHVENNSLEAEIFNAIVGFEDNQRNDNKKKRSERLFAARRAIEMHRENKALSQYLNDSYADNS